MAYFPMVPKGGAGGFSELLIDYDPNEMAGIIITLSHAASAEGHTPESYTATLDNTGEVEVDVKNLGLWVITWTHEGQSYREEYDVHYYGYHHIMLHEGFTWRQWVVAGGINIQKYNSLADLLANQEDIRRLCTIHAAVDYMCEFASVNNDLETIINTGLFAKWVNLRDYALDNMEANSAIKDVMDEADLYGYGELVYENNEWKPKGNVPVMTSNTAPYGEAFSTNAHPSNPAWGSFDKSTSSSGTFTNAVNNVIGYRFTNPIMPKKLMYSMTDENKYVVKASNDGSTWDTISEEFTGQAATDVEIPLTATKYYLYCEICETAKVSSGTYTTFREIQFYGRELKVSVPTMTSDTTPYGEAFQYDYGAQGNAPYRAFDKNAGTETGNGETGTTDLGYYIGYDFKKPINPVMIYAQMKSTDQYTRWPYTFKIQGSNNGSTWDDLTNVITSSTAAAYAELNNTSNIEYRMVRLRLLSQTHTTTYVGQFAIIDFYGKDYSECEWDTDHPRHYLYDHGVELEDFVYNAVGSGSTSEEANDEIYLEIPASSQRATSALASADLTDYSVLRAVAGKQWVATVELTVGPNARPSYASHGIEAYVDIAPPVNKNNLALSVASFNASRYVGPYAGNNSGSVRCLGTISELWLE